MHLRDWLQQFRRLHAAAKQGALRPEELANYHAAQDEFARMLLSAQHVIAPRDGPVRRHLRVTRALQVDIEFFDGTQRAVTVQLSTGGFGALLARAPRVGDEARVALRIPGGDRINSVARVVDYTPRGGSNRVSFEFVGLAGADLERLQTYIFDVVLEQLGTNGSAR